MRTDECRANNLGRLHIWFNDCYVLWISSRRTVIITIIRLYMRVMRIHSSRYPPIYRYIPAYIYIPCAHRHRNVYNTHKST